MSYEAFFDEYRTFGVEIETFGVPRYSIMSAFHTHGLECIEVSQTNDVIRQWRLSNDSSIQGQHSVEVVSPPLSGSEGLEEVGKVVDLLYVLGCKVNASCGFHVHWNCGDFTGKNVLSLLRFYAKFEPVIDFLVAPSRRGNINMHCMSLQKDEDLGWINGLDPSERKRASEIAMLFERNFSVYTYEQHTHRSSRYHKVNISAYNLYGTVEFRQHQGTLSREKAINWIVFTQQLVNKAKYVSVSKQPSSKPTLGELLRSLKIVDHKLVKSRYRDQRISHLQRWLKKRYAEFKQKAQEGADDEEQQTVSVARVFADGVTNFGRPINSTVERNLAM